MESRRGSWPELVAEAASVSSVAAELSAISEPELPELLEFLTTAPRLPFRYVSVHAPSKQRAVAEDELVALLMRIPVWVDAIVLHPDTMQDHAAFRALGRRLLIENMDTRKDGGRTADQLAAVFAELPAAGVCFDIAHAKDVDPTMGAAVEILDRFSSRLRHVHISSLDEAQHHVPLTAEDEELFAPVLERCRDVPWILEAPPPGP
jgi:sugar phosphate isomerase/epimerase